MFYLAGNVRQSIWLAAQTMPEIHWPKRKENSTKKKPTKGKRDKKNCTKLFVGAQCNTCVSRCCCCPPHVRQRIARISTKNGLFWIDTCTTYLTRQYVIERWRARYVMSAMCLTNHRLAFASIYAPIHSNPIVRVCICFSVKSASSAERKRRIQ